MNGLKRLFFVLCSSYLITVCLFSCTEVMDTVRNLFHRLQSDDDRLPALLDGKAYLVNAKSTTLKELISVQDLLAVFPCLDTDNSEQISTVLFILKLLLPIFDAGLKVEVLAQCLWAGLSHADNDVKKLCLDEFKQCCNTEVGNSALVEGKHVVKRIIELIGDEEMSIALSAVDVLTAFGSFSLEGANVMLRGELLEDLQRVMKKNDHVRYRVYDIIVGIQGVSCEHLAICDASKLLKKLVAELMGDDVLVRVVCVATLANMTSQAHSLEYLKSNGVINRLISLIMNSSSDPCFDMYMPEVVKFFGKMCHLEGPQNVVTIFPEFVNTIFILIGDQDLVRKKIGIETLGIMGLSVEGKHVLAKQGEKITNALKDVGRIVEAEGTELRLIAVNAVSQLLCIDPANQTDDLSNLCLKWFQCISQEPVDTVVSLCRQPFVNIKCAGFHLVRTISCFDWGLEILVEYPTFVEFILDRSADNEKESRDARYEAVKGIAESPRCVHIFGNHNYLKFCAYVKQGPIYQKVVNPEVAMETT